LLLGPTGRRSSPFLRTQRRPRRPILPSYANRRFVRNSQAIRQVSVLSDTRDRTPDGRDRSQRLSLRPQPDGDDHAHVFWTRRIGNAPLCGDGCPPCGIDGRRPVSACRGDGAWTGTRRFGFAQRARPRRAAGHFPAQPSVGGQMPEEGSDLLLPGVLSTTWSVVPPSGVASVAGTNPNPAWVAPPSGIFWEQAVTPPPTPSNPIIEQAGPTPFIFSASFGPLPPPSSVHITVSGIFSADNDGSVWINGVPVNLLHIQHQAAYCPPNYGPPPAGFGAKCFVTTFNLSTPPGPPPGSPVFHAGLNAVDVRVHNNELVSGFMLDGLVTATCIK
jgi:hypothetical protein